MSGVQILLLCVGGLALLCGVLIAVMRVRTIFYGKRVEGTIVGVAETSGGLHRNRPVTMYAPIVEYVHEGRKHKFTSSMATREPIATGGKVPVMYLPSDPDSSAEIGSNLRVWGFPIAALFVGGIFVGIALFANLR